MKGWIKMENTLKVRRVVTGHDEQGKATVKIDEGGQHQTCDESEST